MFIPLAYVDDACVCNVMKKNGRKSLESSIFKPVCLFSDTVADSQIEFI